MNYWKDVAIRRMNGWDDDDDAAGFSGDLETYARLLGGEVDGKFIRCPSPRRSADDRSCCVRIDGPSKAYIYDCEGPLGAAYARVRKLLKLAPAEPSKDNSAYARRILDETLPASGTIVETCLRNRGIKIPLPSCLYFHCGLKHTPTGYHLPAMVAARTSIDGSVNAIHRTYLKHDGSGKASVEPVRMDLGLRNGGSIRLADVADELMIGEGIETTLSAMQMYGLPGWAAGSAGAMREVTLPTTVTSVIILADGDNPGEQAARFSAQRWLREGRRVRIARAPWGKDFNDVLIAKAAS
jgi:hypothetical protein